MLSHDVNDPKSSALAPEDLEKVLSSIDFPTCPDIVKKALAETRKEDPDLRVLVNLISAAPSMSAAALKLANSVLYRSREPVSTVRHAVERLGTKAVSSIVIAVALRSSVDGLHEAWLDSFWRRATKTALIAALIARRQFGISQDAAYTFALFHDAGIPMMVKRFNDYAGVVEASKVKGQMLMAAESEYFPCTHEIIGSLMLRNWGLPPVLGLAIRFHHAPDAYELPDQTLPGSALSLIAVTQIAEHLATESLGEVDLEVGVELFEKALSFIGISHSELDELRQCVVTVIEEP